MASGWKNCLPKKNTQWLFLYIPVLMLCYCKFLPMLYIGLVALNKYPHLFQELIPWNTGFICFHCVHDADTMKVEKTEVRRHIWQDDFACWLPLDDIFLVVPLWPQVLNFIKITTGLTNRCGKCQNKLFFDWISFHFHEIIFLNSLHCLQATMALRIYIYTKYFLPKIFVLGSVDCQRDISPEQSLPSGTKKGIISSAHAGFSPTKKTQGI